MYTLSSLSYLSGAPLFSNFIGTWGGSSLVLSVQYLVTLTFTVCIQEEYNDDDDARLRNFPDTGAKRIEIIIARLLTAKKVSRDSRTIETGGLRPVPHALQRSVSTAAGLFSFVAQTLSSRNRALARARPEYSRWTVPVMSRKNIEIRCQLRMAR